MAQQMVPTARQPSVTADGAESIWNLSADYFPDSTHIGDWSHATHHWSEAALALFPEASTRPQAWFNARQNDLFPGNSPFACCCLAGTFLNCTLVPLAA